MAVATNLIHNAIQVSHHIAVNCQPQILTIERGSTSEAAIGDLNRGLQATLGDPIQKPVSAPSVGRLHIGNVSLAGTLVRRCSLAHRQSVQARY